LIFEQENWFVFGAFRQGLDGWELQPEPGSAPSQTRAFRGSEGLLVEQSVVKEGGPWSRKPKTTYEPAPSVVLCQSLLDLPVDRQAVMRARLRLVSGFARLSVRFWDKKGAEIIGGHQWAAPSAEPSADWQSLEYDVVIPTEAQTSAAGILFSGRVKAAVAECEFRLIDDTIEAYRSRLFAKVEQNCDDLPEPCRDAFQQVPRHIFLPDTPAAVAYTDDAIATRFDEIDGARVAISSSSQPSMMALMLKDLDLRRGMRVLEIGTGTGYNAALLAAIAGEDNVTSIDLDREIVEAAGANLDRAGVTDVDLHTADGWQGWASRAPYDRIIITVGVPDIADAWVDQLVDGGVIVMPLSVQCAEFSIAFRKEGDRLKSTSIRDCKFMDLRGENARSTYHPTETGFIIKHSGLNNDEVAAIASIMERPWTEISLPEQSPRRPELFAAYLAFRHWPTVGVSGSLLAPFGVQPGGGAYAIVDIAEQSAAIPQACFGGPSMGEKLKQYHSEWVKLGQPGTKRLHLTAYPRSAHPSKPRVRATAERGVIETPSAWILWEF